MCVEATLLTETFVAVLTRKLPHLRVHAKQMRFQNTFLVKNPIAMFTHEVFLILVDIDIMLLRIEVSHFECF